MPTVTRTNLCTNPAFEAGITGWAAGGSPAPAVAQSAAQAQNRTKSLLITWAAGNTFFPGAYYTLATTANQQYTVSAYVYVPSGNPPVYLLIGGFSQITASPVSTLTDQWQRLSVTFTASASSHSIAFTPSGAVTAGQLCYADSVLAEQANVAASYFDGASSGCQWTGTADLSTSQQLSGPLSIVATPDLLNEPPRYAIFVSGAPLTTAQITRTDPDGNVRPVRGGDPATLVGTQAILYDYEAPYGAANLVYTVIPADGSANAFVNAAPLATTQARLIHPGVPGLSMKINGVMRGQRAYTSGSAEHVILGAKYPKTVTDGARKSARYQLTIRTKTAAENTALSALLATSVPVLLQLVYPFTTTTLWQYLNVDSYTEDEVTRRFGDPQRVWTLEVTHIDRPAGGIAAQRTYADVLSEVGTYADLLTRYTTYAGMLTGVPGT